MSKYEEGARAEFVVAEMLKSDGWYIANASSLDEVAGDDGAPLVRGKDGNKITPDILAIRLIFTGWIYRLSWRGTFASSNNSLGPLTQTPRFCPRASTLVATGNVV